MWAFFSHYYLWTILALINKNLELMLFYHEIFPLQFLLYLIILLLVIIYTVINYFYIINCNSSYFVITMIYKIGNNTSYIKYEY